MGLTKEKRNSLKLYLLRLIDEKSSSIVSKAAKQFSISRQAVYRHLKQLIASNIITSKGTGKTKAYQLKTSEQRLDLNIFPKMEESIIWTQEVLPLMPELNKNVMDICSYGFTEMLNNVIDHSESKNVQVFIRDNMLKVEIWVFDYGIGIFKKIQKYLNLSDPKHAILELAKGKFTTDPEKHTGEGIFFTSRIFDKFEIMSGKLYFSGHKNSDWLLESEKRDSSGTFIFMEAHKDSKLTIKSVFDEYTSTEDDYGFSKTIIPVKLLQYEGEELLSRSQAKRLIVRFDRFKEVILDFDGVKIIGRAFADELFRVFHRQYPEIHLRCIRMNKDVEGTVKHGFSG